ncbi:MAG: hypothetical protein GY816_09075 [Cytophagales bacterium]|nr:hypothetical protein [Cytophagales bacterium]
MLSTHSVLGLWIRHDINSNTKERFSKADKIAFLQHKIELLVNPNEEDSRLLIDKMWELNDASKSTEEQMDDKLYTKTQEEIVRVTQRILKTEWERVKKLD